MTASADTRTEDSDGTSAQAVRAAMQAGYLDLARAVLYREYLIFVRYPANAVGGIVISVFFFGLLFYGGRMLAGQAITDSIEASSSATSCGRFPSARTSPSRTTSGARPSGARSNGTS